MKYRKLIISWLNLCIATISILVLVGGITRLTDSGLSITEWDLVGGVWYPSNQEMIENFDKYRASSEFKNFRDSSFTLDDFKFIFFWEYFHRILGRVIGVLFLIPLLYFIIIKAIPKKEIVRFVNIFLWRSSRLSPLPFYDAEFNSVSTQFKKKLNFHKRS